MVGAMCAAVSVPLAVPFAMPVAAAQPCPDIEVIFARGTGAPAGLGWLGEEQAFAVPVER